MTISKQEFFTASTLKRKAVFIEPLGGSVEIVEMDLQTRQDVLALSRDGKTAEVGEALMLSCVPILSESTKEDIAQLSPVIVEEIASAVFVLSGLIGSDEEAAKN